MKSAHEQQKEQPEDWIKAKKFADISRGIFFVVAAVSLIVVMFMFVRVWQPIWVSGFKDFHTISNSINKLNETAKPASASVPLMLEQMTEMNRSMQEMKVVMLDMQASMQNLEQITPNIQKMNTSIETMTLTLSTQMGRMTYIMDQIEGKLSPVGMMPFNW